MKRCTTCGRRWEVAGSHCPEDGAPLVADDPGANSPSTSATWSARQSALAAPRPAPRHELARGDCVGEYVIEGRIGVGGMGVVYGARHPVIGKRAAIKILNAKLTADDEAVSRFVQEAQAVNRIGHANIVDIFSFGTLDDGRSYFAMEWLQGETLGQRLRRGPLSIRESTSILATLCRALEAAHAAGVIHRDLKPDNVFLATDDDGWRVKLLDFGIAKLSAGSSSISRTATGVAMGTPLYMAPEQARGEAVDGRTDVYALGLVAYAMVCGEELFGDEGSAIEILAAQISKPPRPPRARAPGLPVAFEALILQMLAKPPGERPALVEVRRQLAAIADDAGRAAPPAAAGPPTMPVSAAGLPPSRPPTMPDKASGPDHAIDAAADANSEGAIAPHRRWGPLGLVAFAVLAGAAITVIVMRLGSGPAAPRSPAARRALPPATAPAAPVTPASVAIAPPAPAPVTPASAASAPPPPAPVTPASPAASAVAAPASVSAGAATAMIAELAVEPGSARLVVDGQPVALVGGRAAIALEPGEHAAVASAGGRATRKQFTVAAGHTASVSLRVPVTAPVAGARAPAQPGEDVDAVQDPFRR